MDRPLSFQEIILTLQDYWSKQGCLIWQPYYTQVGAGTYNPATYLRVLGPEPWNVGYVEPSVRPDDGRYGENPNRLQQHYQFQVILKPDPGQPAGALPASRWRRWGSTRASTTSASSKTTGNRPALGAWGLGWEVWLDGQEITQFTYFQQAGGIRARPGLGGDHLRAGAHRHGAAARAQFPRDPVEPGPHLRRRQPAGANRNTASITLKSRMSSALRQMYDLFEAEANRALEKGLVLPAHDYVLKCSHTFNILDARGAVGVTERQALFGRMRDLARRVAEAYLEQRQSAGVSLVGGRASRIESTSQTGRRVKSVGSSLVDSNSSQPTSCSKLAPKNCPPRTWKARWRSCSERVPALLDELRLAHGDVQHPGHAAPPGRARSRIWPPASPTAPAWSKARPPARAFDAHGQPTKAAEGFARSRGLEVSQLQRARDRRRAAMWWRKCTKPGRPAGSVLAEALPGLVAGHQLRQDHALERQPGGLLAPDPLAAGAAGRGRWCRSNMPGCAPGASRAGCASTSPRRSTSPTRRTTSASSKPQGILLDPAERRAAIAAQVRQILAAAGAAGERGRRPAGRGDPAGRSAHRAARQFRRVPPEAARRGADLGDEEAPALLPGLRPRRAACCPISSPCATATSQHLDVVADGNEQVIRARFADAAFFIGEDLKHKLEDNLPRLGTLTFQFKLGSMLDKSQRIEALVEKLRPFFGLDDAEMAAARRAAAPVQGRPGLAHGDRDDLRCRASWGAITPCIPAKARQWPTAIYEHYLPRSSGDALPASKAGLLVERWPTGWIRWPGCSPPGWPPAAPRIPLPSAAPRWGWCRR